MPQAASFVLTSTDQTYEVDKFIEHVDWPEFHFVLGYMVMDEPIVEIYSETTWSSVRGCVITALANSKAVSVYVFGGTCIQNMSGTTSISGGDNDNQKTMCSDCGTELCEHGNCPYGHTLQQWCHCLNR